MPSLPDTTQAEALASIRGATTTTVTVAAILAGTGLSAMYEAIGRGDVESFRIGRRIVVPVAPLLRQLGLTPEELDARTPV